MEYEMSEEDLETILNASKPVPYLVVSGRPPRNPQENANAAWMSLGGRMDFKPMTVRPILGKGDRFFTADPT